MEKNPQINIQDDDELQGLAKAKAWWDKHGTKVLLVVLVISLAITGKRLYDRHLEQQRDDSWGGLASATSPEVSNLLAESYDKPGFQAAAYLRAGDMLLHKAFLLPADKSTPPAAQTDGAADATQDRNTLLTQAQAYYQKVIALSDASELFQLNAKLGLAAVAEELRETATAKAIYLEIETQAGEKYPSIAAQARQRGIKSERLARPVQFAREIPRPLLPSPSTPTLGPTGIGSPLPDLPGDFLTPTPPSPPVAP